MGSGLAENGKMGPVGAGGFAESCESGRRREKRQLVVVLSGGCRRGRAGEQEG